MNLKVCVLHALLFAVPLLGYAQDCPPPKEINDILECLKEKHSLIQIKDLEVKNVENLDNVLGQRPNPVLDIQSVHANDSRQTQIMLTQEIDIGGKLEALKSKGGLIYQVKKKELAITKEEIIEEVLLNIHHMIHINETLKVNREVLSSLTKVTSALTKRPALNPEQEASLLNFRLQQGEVRNIIALLEDEEEEMLLFFLLNGGYNKQDVLKVMEDHHHELSLSGTQNNLSLNLERLGLETKLAETELNLQKAVAWDGISIGPMFMDDKLENISEKLYGVAATIPLPFWQRNGAGKAQASISLANIKRQFSLIQKKEGLQKDSLQERVSKLKASLKQMPEEENLLKTHRRIEGLYTKGLITPTSYLDSHRIWRDVTSSRLELEEKILKLSIDYFRLTGKLNEVHL